MATFIHSDVNQNLSIVDVPGKGMMEAIGEVTGQDYEDIISETFNNRAKSIDELINDDSVQWFVYKTWTVQKTAEGTRAWNIPLCLNFNIYCPEG